MPTAPICKEEELCQGIFGSHGVPALEPDQPSKHSPQELLDGLDKLGDSIQSRPVFAELLAAANDKLHLLGRVKPYLFVGTKDGIRSSFCGVKIPEPQFMWHACHLLQVAFSLTCRRHHMLMILAV